MRRLIALFIMLLPITATSQESPRDFRAVAGVWNVTYDATFSTCDSVKPGDRLAAQWLINVVGHGSVELQENGGATMGTKSYKGRVIAGGQGMFVNYGQGRVIEVSTNGAEVKGRRFVAHPIGTADACLILYEVHGRR